MKKYSCILLTLALTGSFSSANNAVSELNGKLDGSYGDYNSTEGWTTEGSLSIPIADSYGFQLDGLYSDIGKAEFKGMGAHFFWRDSQVGLLGLTGGAVMGEVVDSFELGAEGEYYLESLTLGAKVSFANIDYDVAVPFIETDKDGIFGLFYVTAYPLDSLSLSLGFEHRFDNNAIQLEAEYDLPIDGLSIYARTMSADHGYGHSLIGLRYYFGSHKSLKQRHREDDPRSIVQNILYGIGSYGAEYNERGNRYLEDNGIDGSYGNYGVTVTSVGGFYGVEDYSEIFLVGLDDLYMTLP